MYYRPQGYRYPRDMNLPPNYGGSIFSKTPEEVQISSPEVTDIENEEIDTASNIIDAPPIPEEESKAKPASLFSSMRLGSLFNGRIGGEELLILAIILLLSDSDGNDDLILLLVLLLFMGEK